ncbi:MAG: ABC transporter permease [Bacillota bacterium]|nr:ABC transporter permease [Bacillota bacterium]
MLPTIIAWFNRTVMFGTVMMYGATGEIITEKSGHLNLGVPGIAYIGGFTGFATAFYYERSAAAFNPIVCILLSFASAFIASALMGLIYSFITITLKANQNVTGLTITIFGVGVGNFFGKIVMGNKTVAVTPKGFAAYTTKIPFLSGTKIIGDIFFKYGFMVYLAIIIALVVQYFLSKTRSGLNLRAVGEDPAAADAAGISVTKYKYLATCIGAGISGLGGLYYVLEYNKGMWATENGIEALGWLAVALVIFATWKPVNIIWGALLFGFLSWAYQYLPNIGITIPNYAIELVQTLPYIVTMIVLVFASFRNKKENQPPSSLGLSYFREER